MAATCVTPIRGRIMRLIKLDTCGNPVTGASSAMSVNDGFISVKSTPQYEDGQEFTEKRADGALCVNEKDSPQLKRAEVEITLCVMDPDKIVMMTGDRLLSSAATGTGVAFLSSLVTARFSLEVWQNIAGRAACTGGVTSYVYWAWPNLGAAKVGDITIENGALKFSLTAESQEWGTRWGTLPTLLPPNGYLGGSLAAGEHYAYNVTTIAPPVAACGAALLT